MQSSLTTPTPGETNGPPSTPPQTPANLPTTDPHVAATDCLLGIWEFTDLGRYIMAAIPPELAAEYTLQYSGSDGKAYFTLSPDGNFDLNAEQLKLLFKAKISIFPVTLTVSINGNASGRFTVEGNQLTVTSMDTSRLSASAKAAGQDVLDSSQIIAAIPLINPPNNMAEYTCSEKQLMLELPTDPANIPGLSFQRIQE